MRAVKPFVALLLAMLVLSALTEASSIAKPLVKSGRKLHATAIEYGLNGAQLTSPYISGLQQSYGGRKLHGIFMAENAHNDRKLLAGRKGRKLLTGRREVDRKLLSTFGRRDQ